MGFNYRRTKAVGKKTRMSVSKSGASLSRKFGPVTINSRGRITIRLFKGATWRL